MDLKNAVFVSFLLTKKVGFPCPQILSYNNNITHIKYPVLYLLVSALFCKWTLCGVLILSKMLLIEVDSKLSTGVLKQATVSTRNSDVNEDNAHNCSSSEVSVMIASQRPSTKCSLPLSFRHSDITDNDSCALLSMLAESSPSHSVKVIMRRNISHHSRFLR